MNSKTKVFAAALAVVALAAFGLVTAAFADGPQDAADEARPWGPGHSGGQWFGPPMLGPCAEGVSELLGLSREEIMEQRHQGMSLVEIAAAQGVDEQTLTNAVLAARQEALQQQVTDGALTQEQADAILARLENGELGLGHRHGGMHQGFFGQQISPEALQEKVAEGVLTQEQADAILARLESGEPCLGAGLGRMGHWGQQTGDGANWGEPGLGAGLGQMRHWGQQTGDGANWSEPGLGAVPGGMHRWGPMMR
jgi:hypothetical protein